MQLWRIVLHFRRTTISHHTEKLNLYFLCTRQGNSSTFCIVENMSHPIMNFITIMTVITISCSHSCSRPCTSKGQFHSLNTAILKPPCANTMHEEHSFKLSHTIPQRAHLTPSQLTQSFQLHSLSQSWTAN